ncbi:MAG: hypothetical protein RL134_2553 [Actinomycetota bacterium]
MKPAPRFPLYQCPVCKKRYQSAGVQPVEVLCAATNACRRNRRGVTVMQPVNEEAPDQ